MPRVRRVTITIPAELADRIQKFRHRLNLSLLATDAITEAVEQLEWQNEQLRRHEVEREDYEQKMQRLRTLRQEVDEWLGSLQDEMHNHAGDPVSATERRAELDDMLESIDRLEGAIKRLYQQPMQVEESSGRHSV
jgi:hypothetical protein